jgi:hypothetical protein
MNGNGTRTNAGVRFRDHTGCHMEQDIAVTAETTIEELIEAYPASVGYLLDRGIVCIKCGEPVWDTLGNVISRKGMDVSGTIAKLREFLGETK